ncbi:astacin, partial [Teladorsagia circumcincta]
EQLSALESDIENPSRAKRQIAQYATRWTNNKVYYFFDANITVPNRQYTRTVLKYLQQRTCLSFIESTTAARRIKVFPGAGCYSYVGMLSGVQELSLASGCMVVSHNDSFIMSNIFYGNAIFRMATWDISIQRLGEAEEAIY